MILRSMTVASVLALVPALAHGQNNFNGGFGNQYGQFGGQQFGGQFGGSGWGNNSQFGPNPYNRNTQPLSPYMNLMRGGNTAANYYYGVRPGTQGTPLGSPFSVGPGSMGRQTFFPQIDNLYELDDTVKPTDGIRPTGHPFGFGNALGYFGSSGQGGNRGNQRQSGAGLRGSTGR